MVNILFARSKNAWSLLRPDESLRMQICFTLKDVVHGFLIFVFHNRKFWYTGILSRSSENYRILGRNPDCAYTDNACKSLLHRLLLRIH